MDRDMETAREIVDKYLDHLDAEDKTLAIVDIASLLHPKFVKEQDEGFEDGVARGRESW